MTELERYFAVGRAVGCPEDQMDNFERAGVILQERQLAASAAARLCDRAGGPRRSATAGPGGAARATGSWRRWGRMIVSGCRG